MLLVPERLFPRVWPVKLCLTACRGTGEGIMDWKMSHESCCWQNTISFQYEFKEHSGEKVIVRDVPKSQWCGEGSTEGSGSVWDRCHSQRREGWNTRVAEGELVWLLVKLLLKSAVSSADTNSSRNSHTISFWFYPVGIYTGRGCVSRAGGAGEQEQMGAVWALDSVPGSDWGGICPGMGWPQMELWIPSGSLYWCLGALGCHFVGRWSFFLLQRA